MATEVLESLKKVRDLSLNQIIAIIFAVLMATSMIAWSAMFIF